MFGEPFRDQWFQSLIHIQFKLWSDSLCWIWICWFSMHLKFIKWFDCHHNVYMNNNTKNTQSSWIGERKAVTFDVHSWARSMFNAFVANVSGKINSIYISMCVSPSKLFRILFKLIAYRAKYNIDSLSIGTQCDSIYAWEWVGWQQLNQMHTSATAYTTQTGFRFSLSKTLHRKQTSTAQSNLSMLRFDF